MNRETQNKLAKGAQERREVNIRERLARPDVKLMLEIRREAILRARRAQLRRAQSHMVAAE